jgi:polysaccharide export outer membrane protein
MATVSFSADEQTSLMPLKDYIIGPGDVIEISVWKDDALAKDVTVLPDGRISFPLIGDIIAAGKTVEGLRKELSNKIKPFVPEPNISLIVKQVNSMFIYIIGRVNSPGRFALNTNVNVLQALAIAGGLNPFAKKNKVSIFRENNGQTQIIEFRYDDVSEGKHLEQNIYLKRGDVIVVP